MTGQSVKTLALAAPAYNEEAGIEAVVFHWLEYLRGRTDLESFEIVVCNDGSSDDTGRILGRLASKTPELRVIDHPVNQGAATALATAIRNTTKDWVLVIDSDGQFPIENLDRMIEALHRFGSRAVIGVRRRKQDGVIACVGSYVSGLLCNLFFNTRYRDFNSAFKLVDGAVLRALPLEAKGLNYSTEITAKLIEREIHLVEADIEHHPRERGKSSRKALQGAWDRFLFVTYLGYRQFLIRLHVLKRPVCSP